MDRYEFKLRTDQMRQLLKEKKYDMAAQVADSINWKKVKMISQLCLAGEVYQRVKRYDEGREVLEMAYSRSPIGRNIVYRLTLICIADKDLEGAEYYYNKFIEIAPRDETRYLLRYQIAKAKNRPLAERITILEDYKNKQSSEKWNYELARLYHEFGDADKCVDVCDELILWFGEGGYVEKALELKMLYEPLTFKQEEIYTQIKQNREKEIYVSTDDELDSGEIVCENLIIPQVEDNVTTNTINLQKELADNMQQIMKATERTKVSEQVEEIKRIAGQVSHLVVPDHLSENEKQMRYGHIQTDEEIDGELRGDFAELLSEDNDGQIALNVPEHSEMEEQVRGQLSIEDVLAGWEKTKVAAEGLIEEAEQKKLDSAKARAIQEAQELMGRLQETTNLAELNLKQELEKARQGKLEVESILEENEIKDIDREEPGEVTEEATEEATEEISDETAIEDMLILPKISIEDIYGAEIGEPISDLIAPESEMEAADQEIELTDEHLEESNQIEDVVEEVREDIEQVEEDAEQVEEDPEQVEEGVEQDREVSDQISEGKEMEDENEAKLHKFTYFSPKEKDIFSYFATIPGVEKQVCCALEMAGEHTTKEKFSRNNILIIGERGSGKTKLATNMIKVMRSEFNKKGKVGRISATSLNNKDIVELVSKMVGGYLIIEKAGDLSIETMMKLSLALEQDTAGLVVFMEDSKKRIQKLIELAPEFMKKFTATIRIPIFTNDELVQFAKTYALESDYKIDEMGILALYNRISTIQKVDRATTIIEVKEIIDEAMEKAEKGGIKRRLANSRKKKDDDQWKYLLEMDFGVIG